MNTKQIVEDLFIVPGCGASYHVGSDTYPMYVSETLEHGVIGVYEPKHRFTPEHPWEAGDTVVDPYDENHPTEFYLKRRYGNWWTCDSSGKPIQRFHKNVHFGHAIAHISPYF